MGMIKVKAFREFCKYHKLFQIINIYLGNTKLNVSYIFQKIVNTQVKQKDKHLFRLNHCYPDFNIKKRHRGV